MNTKFNFKRLGLLLKRFFIENKKSELMYWGILTVVMFLIQDQVSFYLLLYIGGVFFAAKQFKAFENTPSGMQYLLTPATHIEKIVSAVLLHSVYYFLMMLLSYSLANALGYLIHVSNFLPEYIGIFSKSFDLFHQDFDNGSGIAYNMLTTSHLLKNYAVFLIGQSIFMFGALYFNKHAVLKTIVAQFVIYFVFVIIFGIVFKTFFGQFSIGPEMFIALDLENTTLVKVMEITLKVFLVATAPFFWLVSYFRLTEKEV